MITERGIEVLQVAERQLREFLAEAAASGDYDAVVKLNEWARDVGDLVRSHGQKAAARRAADGQVSAVSAGGTASRQRAATPAAPVQRKRKGGKAHYPRFTRDDNELVKTGWSRRKKREYRHRAPRRVVDALVGRVVELDSRDLFNADDIFPLKDPKDGQEVPSYQAYLCLAWLREEGLVEQQGRQGYVVAQHRRLQEDATARWDKLPLE